MAFLNCLNEGRSRMHGEILFQNLAYLTWKEFKPQLCITGGISRSLRGPRVGLSLMYGLNSGKRKGGCFIRIILYIVREAK